MRSKVISVSPSRSTRADGSRTRLAILEVAARLFADKGFDRATSKEICERSGVNMAAVNYHFGSKSGLYEQVLVEAHAHVVSLQALQDIAASADDAPARLVRLLQALVPREPGTPQHWGVRVLMQEMLAPTRHMTALVQQAVLPKAAIVFKLVGDVLGLPPTHPAVQRGVALVLLPCILLTVAPQQVRSRLLPALEADLRGTVDDMAHYALAGLAALRQRHAGHGAAAAKPSAKGEKKGS